MTTLHLFAYPYLWQTKTALLFLYFSFGWPQWGLKDELVFCLQTASGGGASISPLLADLYCWLRVAPIKTTLLVHSCSLTLKLVLCSTCILCNFCDFALTVLNVKMYFSKKSCQSVIFKILKLHFLVARVFFPPFPFFVCASFSLLTSLVCPRKKFVP